MADQRFGAHQHVRRHGDFARAYARRRSAADGMLIVYGCENKLSYARLGLSVGRKVGGAVVRNRWKRLIREAFRTHQSEIPSGIDWIVIPRTGEDPELPAISRSLVQLSARVARKLENQ